MDNPSNIPSFLRDKSAEQPDAAGRATILQIIPELETGGAELSTVEIAEAIVRAGGRAIVLSEGGRLVETLTKVGGEYHFMEAATKNPAKILMNAQRIAKLCAAEGVDLVHARSRAPAWSARIAAKRAGVPFVTTYHGAYNEKGRIKNWYNSVMASGDVVIANSKYTRDLIKARYGTDDSKLRVIYRGIEGSVFDPDAVDPSRVSALLAAWGLKPDERVILNAARLTSWKGQTVLIQAARLLKDRGALDGCRLVLAGDAQGRTDYVQGLKTQISDAGLDDTIVFAGHVTDMPAALKLAHIAVVASTEPEAFGRAAAEAQIMRCPVVATDIGAPPETVLSHPNVPDYVATGWLVPPSEPGAMAGAIAAALGLSTDGRTEMGDRARAHVLASFSLNAMKQQTLGVYDQLLGTRLEAAFTESAPRKAP
ncbi:MAG: glycosyltransferase family 4 protein [Pseudomonadota bacterium]